MEADSRSSNGQFSSLGYIFGTIGDRMKGEEVSQLTIRSSFRFRGRESEKQASDCEDDEDDNEDVSICT